MINEPQILCDLKLPANINILLHAASSQIKLDNIKCVFNICIFYNCVFLFNFIKILYHLKASYIFKIIKFLNNKLL